MRRLVKSMLESIKSNSFIRRVILGSIVILLMLIAAWGVFQNYKLEKIYAEKAEVYKQVVGALASKYPNDEAIIFRNTGASYAIYDYPLTQTIIMIVAITLVQILITYVVTNNFKKDSLVDRIRYSE